METFPIYKWLLEWGKKKMRGKRVQKVKTIININDFGDDILKIVHKGYK